MGNPWTAHTADTRPVDSVIDGNFKIKGSSFKPGWRISVTSKIAGTEHLYWVHEGKIYHVLCETYPSPAEQTQCIIGAQVKRIEPSLREAIFKAVQEWSVSGSFKIHSC